MSEQEQNKRINQHQRLITNLRERLKNVEADVEPEVELATHLIRWKSFR